MFSKRATYTVTFILSDDIELAERWEQLLKAENTNANKKLKEMIKAEVEKGGAK